MTTSLLSSALRYALSALVATATLFLAGCGKDEKKTAAGDKPAAGVPGITTDELDVICHDACVRRGGYPSPLNYNGYPKSLCTSATS